MVERCSILCMVLLITLWIEVIDAQAGVSTGNLCAMLGNCNGHGRCNTATKTCACFDGYGAATDIANYKSPDCSQRTCPSGPSWGTIATSQTNAHTRTECSDAGLCDRSTGMCRCFNGFEGDACQRNTCLNACSGHGQCKSMREMAQMTNAFPLSPITTYAGAESTTTWDSDRIYGCVCESVWPVGLASGQRQLAQYFGPDCSLVRCPSGDDPLTVVDETDCTGKTQNGNIGVGASGNICHIECANQGICDHTTGVCKCFQGFYGANCASTTP